MSARIEGALGFTCVLAVQNGRVPANFYDPWSAAEECTAEEFYKQRPALADGWYFYDLKHHEHYGPYFTQVIAKRAALRHESPKYLPENYDGKYPILEFEDCVSNVRDYLLHLQHTNKIKPTVAAEMAKLLWDTKEALIEKVYLTLEPEPGSETGIVVTAKYAGKIDEQPTPPSPSWSRIHAAFERYWVQTPDGGLRKAADGADGSDVKWTSNEDETEHELEIFVGGPEHANLLAAELRACGMIVTTREADGAGM
jgi:hypothetical protein